MQSKNVVKHHEPSPMRIQTPVIRENDVRKGALNARLNGCLKGTNGATVGLSKTNPIEPIFRFVDYDHGRELIAPRKLVKSWRRFGHVLVNQLVLKRVEHR